VKRPGWNQKRTAANVGGLFFPQSKSLGIDLGTFSSAMLEKIVHAGTVCTSYLLASTNLSKLADLSIHEKQVERLTRSIGTERVAERDAHVATYEAMRVVAKFETPALMPAPDLAVVMADGGRLQVLDSDATTKPIPKQEEASVEEISAVDLPLDEAEPPAKNRHWREDRVGLLLTMFSSISPSDPSPQIPDVFLNAERMRKLARELTHQAKMMASEDIAAVEETVFESAPEDAKYAPPTVRSSRVLATRNSWEDFTPMLAEAAWAWGFQKASRKAFVADGAKCNWTLQKRCFAQFVPILDFIHALSYVYAAAHAGQTEEKGWACYQEWIQWVWQGQVEKVITALRQRQLELGVPEKTDGTTSPQRIVAKTLTYLQNHQDKMKYDAYRRDGLPITSSLVESTVKLIGQRVKGTEKFWSEDGAEAILQLRADHLSKNQPLDEFWQRRQDSATGFRPYRRAS
jgi:hypothetical protein